MDLLFNLPIFLFVCLCSCLILLSMYACLTHYHTTGRNSSAKLHGPLWSQACGGVARQQAGRDAEHVQGREVPHGYSEGRGVSRRGENSSCCSVDVVCFELAVTSVYKCILCCMCVYCMYI